MITGTVSNRRALVRVVLRTPALVASLSLTFAHSLLEGSDVRLQVVDGGAVTIERL